MATNYVWTGTTSGAWDTNTNWTPTGVPGADAADTARLDGKSTRALTTSPAGLPTIAKLTHTMACGFAIGTPATPIAVKALIVELGLPAEDGSQGPGSDVSLDLNSAAASVRAVSSKPTGTNNLPAYLVKGSAIAKVSVEGNARLGVAKDSPAATATVTTIEQTAQANGSRVEVGAGTTLTTYNQDNGEAVINCAATTILQRKGKIRTEGTGAITTVTAGGEFVGNSSGTVTNLHVEHKGVAEFRQNSTARTVSNATVYGDGRINDNDYVTWTNGIILSRGARSNQLDLGTNITVST